ncbi:teratocarcinoma-derived growth factor-like [Dreissena polymorpha]|nr:teratocarcinoma-derived growth factor-like [Dreissena polymorpha]
MLKESKKNRERRRHSVNAENKLDLPSAPKGDLITSSSKSDNCCLNGGICIMNSFCHCPKPYYGRYCEKEVRHRSCGTIPHGTWMASGCHLCHCFDGNMRCKATTIPGCYDMQYVEGHENDPDYLVGIDNKYGAKDNDFYDTYADNTSDDATSGASGVTFSVPFFSLMAITLLTVIKGS